MVDLVGKDTQGERLVDSQVEAGEQLEQTFSAAAHQHGVIAVFIGGGGDATDRAQHALSAGLLFSPVPFRQSTFTRPDALRRSKQNSSNLVLERRSKLMSDMPRFYYQCQ